MSSVSDARQIVPAAAMPPAPGGLAGADGGEGGGEGGGLNLADAWGILARRKVFLLVACVVLYALVVALTLIVGYWFPAYRSEALLELRPPHTEAYQLADQLVDPRFMEALLQTEARKINRVDVLSEVLSLPEIQQTSFYRWYDTFYECLFDMQRILRVVPVRESQLIEVSLRCRDPEEARLIVDTIVSRYESQYKQDSQQKSQLAFDEMKNTRAELVKELDAKQQELMDFRAQTNVGAIESESQILARNIAEQRYFFDMYDQQAAALQAQLDAVENIDPRDLPISPEDRVIVEADPILRLYRQQVEALDIEIKITQQYVVGENHPRMKLMRGRRDGYYQREVARREELYDDLRERRVSALKQELASLRNVQARIQDQLQESEARQADLDASRVRYERILADQMRLQDTLQTLEGSVLEFQHQVDVAPKSPRLQIIQKPIKAVEPSRPVYELWLGGGVFLALAGAVGLAFLRELTDKAIRTPIDVARHGRLSVLGCIPQLDDEEADVDAIELATRRAPHSLVAEAFRQVRANLMFSGPLESQRVLLIASPGPGNGKTSVAINLAVTLAQASQSVLLVDCNFRRPAIRSAFPGTRAEGLSNILIGQAKLEDLVTPTDLPNLHVLTSGPMPPTPAELLGSAYMREVIEQAKARFDRVIFDGPPILLISDGLVLARQVDGVIVVARAVDNTKGVLKRAREQLEKIDAHVLGAILNGVQARAGGYYRQQYRDFYEYSSDETIPPELPGAAAPEELEDEPAEDDGSAK